MSDSTLPPEQWRPLFDKIGVEFGYRPLANRIGMEHTKLRRLLLGGGTSAATVRQVADAFGVSPEKVRELRSEPAETAVEPFTLPDDAGRLNYSERKVVLSMVRALLDARDRSNDQSADQPADDSADPAAATGTQGAQNQKTRGLVTQAPGSGKTSSILGDVGRRLTGIRQQGLTVWMGTGIDLAEKYLALPESTQGDVADAWRTATRGDAPDPDQISRIQDALDIVLFSTPHSEDTHGLGVNVEVDTDDWATMLDYRDRGIAHVRALAVPPSERASSDDWAEYQRTQLPITDDQATADGDRPLTGTGQKQSSDIDSPEGELLVQYLDAWANLGAACAHVLNKIAHLRKPSLPYETGAVVENVQGILDAVDILFTHHITITHDGEGRSPRMDTVDRAFRRAERAAGALPLADQLRANANRPITLDDKDINDIVATSPVADAIAAANAAFVAAFPNSPSPDELESRMKRDEKDLVEGVEALVAAHAKASKYEESTTQANEAFLYAASLVGADSGRPTGPVAVRSTLGARSGGSKMLRTTRDIRTTHAPSDLTTDADRGQVDDEWMPEAARNRPQGFQPQDPDAYDNTIGEGPDPEGPEGGA